MSRGRNASIVGVILAGGLSRRMGGGDKCLLPLAGRPILAHVVERMRPQVEALVLNANGDPSRFSDFGLPVVADTIRGFAGPLAGILAAMEWARARTPQPGFIATVPGDSPFLPRDLVTSLAAAGNAPVTVARSRGRIHPVVGLLDVALADDLRAFLTTSPSRKVSDWLARHGPVAVDFDHDPRRNTDPFFNVNAPEDLAKAEVISLRGEA
jgi:molybdopterin-guanine dinucleotide biosynthesis protein A